MPTTAIGPERRTEPTPADVRPWQHRLRSVWAMVLVGLVGLLFTGLTALTVTLWATNPAYYQTNPVVDLAFFALGGILVTAGFASQIRNPRIAGLQQTILVLVVLAAAGGLGGRIEPFLGPLVLLLAAMPLVLFHPDRRRLLAAGAGVSRSLAALATIAAAPAIVYAVDMLRLARAAGPSCFLGQCVQGDRYAEAAALTIAVLALALLASARTSGWIVPAWSAGTAAVVLGVASLAFPAQVGALGRVWAVTAVLWGGAFIAAAGAQQRDGGPREDEEPGR